VYALKQVVIYIEDEYWVWKIADSGGKSIFVNDKFLARNDAVNSLVTILNFMQTGVDNRKN
jgi:hypothetical protein